MKTEITKKEYIAGVVALVQELEESYRTDSKPITFALTYGGTVNTLMRKCGLTRKVALEAVSQYKRRYSVSIGWVDSKVQEASRKGYVTGAFGLRLRTPILSQVIYSAKGSLPCNAISESRTAGNMLGQSYSLLNSRTANKTHKDILNSKFRYSIFPVAQIYDANYFLVRDDAETVHFLQTSLMKHMNWKDLPDLVKSKITLGGDLAIFAPSWAKETLLPGNATVDEIAVVLDKLRTTTNKGN